MASGEFVVTKMYLFPNTVTANQKKYLKEFEGVITPPTHDGSDVPMTLRYGSEDAISVIPDANLQSYVRDVGMEMVSEGQQQLPESDPTKINFRFYVVHPFENHRVDGFVEIDGKPKPYTHYGFFDYDSFLVAPRDEPLIDQVVEMPDGTILVPDVLLARLRSKAELAFVLSVAVTSTTQKLADITQLQERGNTDPTIADAYFQTQRAIRMAIHRILLAGYDIREAPFAWAVAEEKPVANPVIDSKHPEKEIPWYAAYAFDYISQYYKDVDYSKLKRGDAEYAEFLGELRKADPEAFAAKK